jgi:hypothetical protein
VKSRLCKSACNSVGETLRSTIGRFPASAMVVLALVTSSSCIGPTDDGDPVPASISGVVVDLDGAPVADARVEASGSSTVSDAAGRFSVSSDADGSWVAVSATGFLTRTRAGFPGRPLLVRLTPDDGDTVALQFGGDVMMGRRFFDVDEDGNRDDALIDDPADVAQHDQLLAPVAPLLRTADITEVNVESPISAQPYIDPTLPRPAGVHPTKEYVFASGPALAPALAKAGVDVVGLANNHQFDLLEDGVRTTMDSMARAGFAPGEGQFGLGATADEAYRPAQVTKKGQRFAFLGCTSILGTEHAVSYVAEERKGGAAPCDPIRIRESVSALAASGNFVVFSVHGGYEYGREASDQVRSLTEAAREAGAGLVVNAHPHVTGGLDWDGRSLVADSLGNLVFDQTVWPTFQSYVLNVHVRNGTIVRAFLEPTMIDRYVAHGLRPDTADLINRTTMGLSRGPFVVDDGVIELDLAPAAGAALREERIPPSAAPGSVLELGEGWLVRESEGADIELGVDLLWTGDFDGGVLDRGAGALWVQAPDVEAVDTGSADRGSVYELRRSGLDDAPIVGSTIHRFLLANADSVQLRRDNQDYEEIEGPKPPRTRPRVPVRSKVTLTGMVDVVPGSRAEVRLSWYPDTRGPSSTQVVEVLGRDSDGRGWQPLRIDADVPADAVAGQVFVVLHPTGPEGGESDPSVRLDDLKVIEWLPPGQVAPSRATHLRTVDGGVIRLQEPGGETLAPALTPVPA